MELTLVACALIPHLAHGRTLPSLPNVNLASKYRWVRFKGWYCRRTYALSTEMLSYSRR
jgi:hypothetical protein